jgi:hypothetical protein
VGVREESYGSTFGSESSEAGTEAHYIAYQHVHAQPPQHHSLCACARACVRACGSVGVGMGVCGWVWVGVGGCWWA